MLVGLTGVGGGSLMTPLLVLLFGFHPATAVGTDLLYASVTKSVGHRRSRHPQDGRLADRRRARHGSLPAAIVTLYRHEPHRATRAASASGSSTRCSAAALVITGIAILFRPRSCAGPSRMREAGGRAIYGADDLPRRDPRSPRLHHLGRRRRAGHHRASHPLSQAPGGADRRQRHRSCRAADLHRGHWPLAGWDRSI